jgi:hypothetical protein
MRHGIPTWTSPNWLSNLSMKQRYSPKVLGDNYQPLCSSWNPVACPAGLPKRSGYGVVSFQECGHQVVLSLGGIHPVTDRRYSEVRQLSEPRFASRPSPVVNCAWSPRSDVECFSTRTGSHLYVLGGHDGRSRLSDCWMSRDKGKTFECMSESALWGGRVEYSAALIGFNTIILVGGRDDNALDVRSDIWRSTDSGKTWECIHPNSPFGARYGSSLLVSDENLFLIGGSNGCTTFDDVWCSSDGGESWERIAHHTPWRGRKSAALVHDPHSGEILLIGGVDSDGTILTDTWASIDQGKSWIPREHLPIDTPTRLMPVIGNTGHLVVYSGDSNFTSVESHTNLEFVQKDVTAIRWVGGNVGKGTDVIAVLPSELWSAYILPYTIDTRLLWQRHNSPWTHIL